MGCRLRYLPLPLTHSKDQDEGHVSAQTYLKRIQSVAFHRLSAHTLSFLRLDVQLQVERTIWPSNQIVAVET